MTGAAWGFGPIWEIYPIAAEVVNAPVIFAVVFRPHVYWKGS
jgi:hypothetical protein